MGGKITVDTNVLVRAAVYDDPIQADVAAKVLLDAEVIAVALPCLCEFVWVLLRVYGFEPAEVASAIRCLESQSGSGREKQVSFWETCTQRGIGAQA